MKLRIEEIRVKAGLTQEGLSELANVPLSTLMGLESGSLKAVSTKALERIADSLCTTTSDLIYKK